MKKTLLLLFISALVVGCGDDETNDIQLNEDNKNANIAGTDQSVTRLEIPRLNSRYDYICHKLSNGTVNYTLEYDKQNLQARWVAYTYDSQSAQQNYAVRTDAWAPEPFYNKEKQYQVNIQAFPGYNRGHIVGSAERYFSKEANEQTFYMSNMSPMNGNFNSIYWGEVEDKVRDNWGRAVRKQNSSFYGGTLYVVKGGTIDENNKRTINVQNTLGDRVQMTVPNYFWIAVLYISESGTARAIGFWMEHKDYQNESNEFLTNLRRSSACSIDELERKTGIDFFCNLPDNIEEQIEASYNISLWPGL